MPKPPRRRDASLPLMPRKASVPSPTKSGDVLQSAISCDFETVFESATLRLKEEQRYRTFVDLERIAGRLPCAVWHSKRRPQRGNDLVLERLSWHEPEHGCGPGDGRHGTPFGNRIRRYPQHRRDEPSLGGIGAGACGPARKASGAGVHVGICCKPIQHIDDRQAHSELPDPLRRIEPQLDDRRRQPVQLCKADLPAQRSRSSRAATDIRRREPPQDRAVRKSLFHGWRLRSRARDLRTRQTP